MLTSIDQRLSKLEGVIIPINAATQKLTKVEESKLVFVTYIIGVNQMKKIIENVTSLFDVMSDEQDIINKGYYSVLTRSEWWMRELTSIWSR